MMNLPLDSAALIAGGLASGPVSRILDAHVQDAELRAKLSSELEQQALAHLTRSAELSAGIVEAEVRSEHWLTRSWRPVLMITLMGFLILAGLILPIADLVVGYRLPFEPRWTAFPSGFWDFLSVGMGGYIGGRSLEKVAGLVLPLQPRASGTLKSGKLK